MQQRNAPKYLLMKIKVVFFILYWSALAFSQSPFHYVWPIDSPFVMTANYGELRPNHFHAGIDFSTRGRINLPVYSIDEGYVSRIRVSPTGYGKCIYVTHPNGKVSVYGHLNAFSLKIGNAAKEFQYSTQSCEIDFTPKPRTIYVRKNEIIGLSGNSGGSTGPHLHFEIRDELMEIPLNPLGFYRLNDNSAPEISSIAFYNLADTSLPKFISSHKVEEVKRDSLALSEDHLTLNSSIVGLAFSGLDRYLPNGNPNNIFAARIYVNDTLVYVHQLNNIPFTESRFVNEFSDVKGKVKYQKCFQPTIFPAGFFGTFTNKGRIILDDKKYLKIKLVLTDEGGNSSRLQFYLRAKEINPYTRPAAAHVFANCSEEFVVSKNDLRLQIPSRTLFYSTALFLENNIEKDDRLSIFPEVNLMQAASLGFKLPPRYSMNREKLLLRGPGTALPLNRNDSVFFAIKEFGTYRLSLDTIAPKIKVDYSARQLKEAWQMDAFSFRISDNMSGIGKYNLWLNNAWVLAEYDAKTDLLTYYFDEETPIGLLQFKLEVFDRVGNRAFFEYVLKK